jgi:hypothetical protein
MISEEVIQVVERCRHNSGRAIVMALDGHEDLGRLGVRGACGALPPAPAPCRDCVGLIREDDLAGFGSVGGAGAEIRPGLVASGEPNGQATR